MGVSTISWSQALHKERLGTRLLYGLASQQISTLMTLYHTPTLINNRGFYADNPLPYPPLWSGFTIPSASSSTLHSNLSSSICSMASPFRTSPSATNRITGSGLLTDMIRERCVRRGELVGEEEGVRSSWKPSGRLSPREVTLGPLPPLAIGCLSSEVILHGERENIGD